MPDNKVPRNDPAKGEFFGQFNAGGERVGLLLIPLSHQSSQ